ncbi:hypothetical protein N3Z16_10775 (plasmid) [Candidatus Megaera polyxenophila]|uniref:hypothetical protein n=1 Tax=Candidatus Megaera polyxenophila TaxID=988779 RepID=UPI00249F04DB|nr:hypothetical protein N3Z16_10775 [Candidatus Megaera polyxenophila]
MGNSGSRGSGGGSGSSSNTGSHTCKSQGGRSWKDNDGVTNICIRGSSTGNSGNNGSGNYPSAHSNSKGGEGRGGGGGSSSTNQESSVYSKSSDKKTFSISEQQSLKKELIELLHELHPNLYPAKFEDWNTNTYGRQQLENGNWTHIEASLPNYKKWIPIRKDFINILHQFPQLYPERFEIQVNSLE